jgi:hypothetical protein
MVVGPARRFLGWLLCMVYVRGGRYGVLNLTRDSQDRPTASDRRTGFDWLIFQALLTDRLRVAAYAADIAATVADRRVLEVGPGPAAVLTRLCLDAGAARVVSVEGDEWAAAAARRRLARSAGGGPADRWQVVTALSTELEPSVVGGEFDVLVCEAYDSIASRENVVETIADLRRRGFRFDRVISRGFETLVAPSAAPPPGGMTRVDRLALGWPGDRDRAAARMRAEPALVFADPAFVDGLRLAAPRRWQAADFEAPVGDGGPASPLAATETNLSFAVPDSGRYAGLVFHNRFLFHGHDIDTGRDRTTWGVMFVPLPLPAGTIGGPMTLVLRTDVPDPDQPSRFTLTVISPRGRSEPARYS